MTYTLWRDAEQVGELVERIPTTQDVGVAGLLRPCPHVTGLEAVRQVRMPPSVPGRPVVHRGTGEPAPGPYRLDALSPEEARGVSARDQFELRDSEGAVLDVDVITLHEVPVASGEGPFPDACRAHGFLEKVWILHAWSSPD